MSMNGECKLSPIRETDSEALFKWVNDRSTVVFNTGYRPVHEPNHQKWLAEIIASPSDHVFGIRTAEGALIGMCQLNRVDAVGRSAELRIRIGEDEHRGMGYGRSALVQLLSFAFDDLNLHRVYLQVYATNARAVRLYESVGFRHVARLVEADYVNGSFVDVIGMAILARDVAPARS